MIYRGRLTMFNDQIFQNLIERVEHFPIPHSLTLYIIRRLLAALLCSRLVAHFRGWPFEAGPSVGGSWIKKPLGQGQDHFGPLLTNDSPLLMYFSPSPLLPL